MVRSRTSVSLAHLKARAAPAAEDSGWTRRLLTELELIALSAGDRERERRGWAGSVYGGFFVGAGLICLKWEGGGIGGEYGD